MRTLAAAVTVLGLFLLTGTSRAHDDGEGERQTKFRAMLVGDADVGDFAVGSAAGSFLEIEGDNGGTVRMQLGGVTVGGVPAAAAMSQLTIAGLVDGAPFTKTFPFDLVDGKGRVRDSLGLAAGDLLEVQTATVAGDPVGVFAVLGLVAGDDDGEHDDHDDGDEHDGEHDDRDDGDDDRHGGWGHHGDHDDLITAAQSSGHGDDDGGGCRGRGDGKLATSLVGDADVGDYAVDSTSGSFLEIEAEEGGELEMRLRGVTDGGGQPVDHDGNQLIITGVRDGSPFTAVFPFALEDGKGKVRARLDLEEGDVLEIASVSVTDGLTVFAVPGVLIRNGDDDDDDGVGDDGDACTGTQANAMVAGDGCSLGQRCACVGPRKALRACLKRAARDIKASLMASCRKGKACRRTMRRLAAERRAVMRSCAAAAHR